jgi:hypothetical protein
MPNRHGEHQVRLKPKYADLYGGILPGEWVPAWAMAERLLALAKNKLFPRSGPVFDPHHFDASGGSKPAKELRCLRIRSSDV